jgi:pimeloyl-ACP methyl ester carboxylesterase
METTKPTVVFVHGAWADNSGFDGSIRALRAQGFRAIGASNPLRELRSDAAYVAALLRSIEGPIVMVGHSYGGAVISNAATGNDQVQALVYINGWVPDEGESLIELAELNDGSLIPDSLRPVQVKNADGSDVVDLYIDQEKFRAAFAGDVDAETAQVMAVAQRPFTETAFGAPSGRPGRLAVGPVVVPCSAPRTGRSRPRRSGTWPSARRRRSSISLRRMPRWSRSPTPSPS